MNINEINSSEIKKALECIGGKRVLCKRCYYNSLPPYQCQKQCIKDTLDLFNQFETENKKLKAENKKLKIELPCFENVVRKEFAERLKDEFPNNSHWVRAREMVDNLLKEMGVE